MATAALQGVGPEADVLSTTTKPWLRSTSTKAERNALIMTLGLTFLRGTSRLPMLCYGASLRMSREAFESQALWSVSYGDLVD